MKHNPCIISGYINGQKFRPSNWSERLCEAGATFDPLKRVMRYSEHLYPRQCEEHGCSVYVNFDALDAELVRYINWFIKSNGMETIALSPTAVSPVLTEVTATTEANAVIAPTTKPQPARRSKVAKFAA